MFNLLKKMILIGSALAAMTAEKIEEVVNDFIKKGELSEKEGRELLKDLVERSKRAKKDLEERIEIIVSDIFKRLNLPSRKELEELKARVERLEKAKEDRG